MWTVPSPSSDARTCWPRRHLPGHNRNAAETGPQSLAFAACDAYSLRTFPEGVRWPSCVRPERSCTRPVAGRPGVLRARGHRTEARVRITGLALYSSATLMTPTITPDAPPLLCVELKVDGPAY